MDLTREVLDRMLELNTPTSVEIDGRNYSTRQLTLMRAPVLAGPQLSTLDALITFIQEAIDGGVGERQFLHVADPTTVELLESQPAREGQRRIFAKAVSVPRGMPSDKWLDQETFIIMAQARIVEDRPAGAVTQAAPTDSLGSQAKEGERNRLLRLVSSLTATETRISADDGISQEATAKRGIAVQERTVIANPFHLSPFRTFSEVPQPVSPFILRVQEGSNGPSLALFEADGGAWKLEAIRAIAAYLQTALGEKPQFAIPILA